MCHCNLLVSSFHFYKSICAKRKKVKMKAQLLSIFVFTVLYAATQIECQQMCSWYGDEQGPGPTACGQRNNPYGMTAAHMTLPCGSRIRVRNLRNGKTVDVTINDQGPNMPGRVVDLTLGAFSVVENPDSGLFPCDYQVI